MHPFYPHAFEFNELIQKKKEEIQKQGEHHCKQKSQKLLYLSPLLSTIDTSKKEVKRLFYQSSFLSPLAFYFSLTTKTSLKIILYLRIQKCNLEGR